MRNKRRILLERETLRTLTALDLVVGGGAAHTQMTSCTLVGCRSERCPPTESKHCTADTRC